MVCAILMVLIPREVQPHVRGAAYASHEPLIKSEKANDERVPTEKFGGPLHPDASSSGANASVTAALGQWVAQGATALAACLFPCVLPRREREARYVRLASDDEARLGHRKKNQQRDWATYPALVDLPDPPGDVYAVSDVHADAERLATLLATHNLVTIAEDKTIHWCGGRSTLIVVGDVINKGPTSLGCIDLLRTLEAQALEAGGRVITSLGNHEAEFLANPYNRKAERSHGINREIRDAGDTPERFLRDDNPRGHWLRTLPFGVRIGSWFFAHGGNSKGLTFAELQTYLQDDVDKQGFAAKALLGRNSILRARAWYEDDAATGAKFSAALGTQHIVFGHDPSALGPKGAIAMGQNGTLFRIDCGLTREVDFSRGVLLRIRRHGDCEAVHACDAAGVTTLLLAQKLPTAP